MKTWISHPFHLESKKVPRFPITATKQTYKQFDGRVVVDSTSYWSDVAKSQPAAGQLSDMWPTPASRSSLSAWTRNARMGGGIRGPFFSAEDIFREPLPPPRGPSQPSQHCSCELCRGLRPHPPFGFRWTEYDMIDRRVQVSLETDGSQESPLHRYLLCSSLLYGLALKYRQWSAYTFYP